MESLSAPATLPPPTRRGVAAHAHQPECLCPRRHRVGGYLGGILAGADKLSRVAWLQSDPAVAQVLGIEAVPSQSTLSRFFGAFTQRSCQALAALHSRALSALPTRRAGETLDLDSWALLHEDGHQEGVAVGFTRHGCKPCHRPLIAALAESKLVANYWLRPGNTACVTGAAEFLRQTVASMPAHIHVGLVRGDAGFGDAGVQETAETLGLKFIFVARLTQKVQALCRHDDAAWQKTEVAGLEVQEVALERPGAAVDCAAPTSGRASTGRGQDVVGGAGVSVSSVGDQPAAERGRAGCVAALQRAGGD